MLSFSNPQNFILNYAQGAKVTEDTKYVRLYHGEMCVGIKWCTRHLEFSIWCNGTAKRNMASIKYWDKQILFWICSKFHFLTNLMQMNRKFEGCKRLISPFLLYFCQLHLIWCLHHGHMCALSWCMPSSCVNAKDGYPWFIHREVVECLMAHF